MSDVFLSSLKVINGMTAIGEFLRDKSLELTESEELFNAIKSFENVQEYVLGTIEQESERKMLAEAGIKK